MAIAALYPACALGGQRDRSREGIRLPGFWNRDAWRQDRGGDARGCANDGEMTYCCSPLPCLQLWDVVESRRGERIMVELQHIDRPLSMRSDLTLLPRMILSLGRPNFGFDLMEVLAAICGASHCAFALLSEQRSLPYCAISRDGTDTAYRQFSLYLSGSYWRSDPMMTQAIRSVEATSVTMQYARVEDLVDFADRDQLYGATHIGERILFCGRHEGGLTILSALRTQEQGDISRDEMTRLTSYAQALMALVRRHAELIEEKSDPSAALTSLPVIEATLRSADVQLSRREIEVCARILFGISTAGIALDLGIGEETVMTYRKRAYRRLRISCQRELLIWYLRLWDERWLIPASHDPILH